MEIQKIELKKISKSDFEERNSDSKPIATDKRIITGYALKFNQRSKLIYDKGLKFVEYILPEAINQKFINSQDIVCLLNHNTDNGVLARSKKGKGTLKLTVDSIGLKYSFEASKSPNGENVYQSILRGDLSASSLTFNIVEGGDRWVKQEDNTYIRYITKIHSIIDVSVVVSPTYESATEQTRKLKQPVKPVNIVPELTKEQKGINVYQE
jgi:HK97 family phage prohead protease